MLHIVNKSPSQSRTLERCLRLAQPGSALLLIEDGVYAATQGNAEGAALRDALEATKELLASQGVVSMTPQDHSGFDHRGRVLVTVKDGKFAFVSVLGQE